MVHDNPHAVQDMNRDTAPGSPSEHPVYIQKDSVSPSHRTLHIVYILLHSLFVLEGGGRCHDLSDSSSADRSVVNTCLEKGS